MQFMCGCIIAAFAFCATSNAASALQIPPCTAEVLEALRDTAHAEPLRLANNMSAGYCLADSSGKLTLLHEAARAGAYGSIPRLIEEGADPFSTDRRGATPLHWAASRGSYEAIDALLESLSPEKRLTVLQAVDAEGLTPLDHAEANSRIRAAATLVRSGAMRGQVLMEGACPGAAVDAVLLSRPSDLADVIEESRSFFSMSVGDCELNLDPREWSLLHLATAVAVLSLAPEESSVDIVKHLLSQGADATREDAYGQTPLYLAVKAGRLDLVQILLDSAPLEVNHLDFHDQTPLLYAAMTGREEVAKLLLSKGADAARPDQEGMSARDWALENDNEKILHALPVVRGVRGSSGKSLPRTDYPCQVLVSIVFLILLSAVWLRIVARRTCLRPDWRCKRLEHADIECSVVS